MKIKDIGAAIVIGAAGALGAKVATKAIEKLENPCTRANIKKKFKVIKSN